MGSDKKMSMERSVHSGKPLNGFFECEMINPWFGFDGSRVRGWGKGRQRGWREKTEI